MLGTRLQAFLNLSPSASTWFIPTPVQLLFCGRRIDKSVKEHAALRTQPLTFPLQLRNPLAQLVALGLELVDSL